MAGLNLLNAVLKETSTTAAFSGFCKHVRFRKSNCRRCVEICPEKAISLDPGPTINNGCSDCGFCVNVCPTEVFENELGMEEVLLNQAKSFLDKDKSQGGKNALIISCPKAENPYEHSLSIPCLGKISENIILGAVLSGFDEIVLIRGICSRCRLMQAEELLTNSIMISTVLLESLGLGKFPVTLKEIEKKREKILSKREIFSKIALEAKNRTAAFRYQREKDVQGKLSGSLECKDGKKSSSRMRLLQKLVMQKGGGNSMVLKYRPEFPWGKIKIDEKKCSACGTCLTLCPKEAISKKLEDGYQIFSFNSNLCSNCSLCKEACPQKAVDFEENFSLAGIFENKAKAVARVKLNSCLICGEGMTAEIGQFCFTCQKRQMGPMQIKI